ncbi:hypothetical protein BDF20DRAFT_832361 [Mycotypha africana]|uniref:uncharacterized protein n=1 Tax=Mycotypha africana TaxID=64632 RepID=UPI00230186D1|nr:uncharacterized protein BDF20DRAFT_832361 [Mycotypha africana]KAI8987423.1 hypothetical protein BDF20DRAFT_832361 [Mycotypha africana]
MVQPNLKIYPFAYISADIYAKLHDQLQILAKNTKTRIGYNMEEQYFDIQGRSQQACDNVGDLLTTNLFPQLCTLIDESAFHGTFEKIEDMYAALSASSSRNNSDSNLARNQGRPFDFDEAGRPTTPLPASGTPASETLKYSNNIRSDNERYTPTPSTHTSVNARVISFSDPETDSSYYESEDGDDVIETFAFAKNVRDPREVLTGPPGLNNQPANYLNIVGNDTGTECSLHDRQIKIVGSSEEAVKEAKLRFRNLQTMFKRRNRGTNIVPCVHYPVEVPEFGLYFCNLERYAQRDYVHILNRPEAPLFVLLPVLKDRTGQYQRPKDLLNANAPMTASPAAAALNQMSPRLSMRQQQQTAHLETRRQGSPQSPQNQRQHQQRQQTHELSLEERMRLATLEHYHDYGNFNQGMAPDQQPLWGENKNFVVRTSAQPSPTPSAPPVNYVGAPAPPKVSSNDDFPSLPSAPRVAPATSKQQTRKVLRISKQKASPQITRPLKSNMEIIKDYNFNNIKAALEDGLTGVRGFSGDIKLRAKLGKVIWTNVTQDIQKNMWKFSDLKDILMGEKKVRPHFSNMTTSSDFIIEKISNVLPASMNKTVHFEIYANVRHQNCLPYKPVVMHMRGNVVEISKIVNSKETVTEIDWCTLDRKFDFQLKLETEQKTRTNVKPYTNFINKFCLSPETKQLAFENIPDFLEVDYVLVKQTTRYRIHFPFIVEITRVERIPLATQPYDVSGTFKIIGDIGHGEVWYDVEVVYSTYDEIFQRNNSLPAGKMANWTVEDILGSDSNGSDALVEYIRCLLLLTEKCEREFDRK